MIICFILMTFIADLRLIMLGEIGSQSLLEVNGLKPENSCSLKVGGPAIISHLFISTGLCDCFVLFLLLLLLLSFLLLLLLSVYVLSFVVYAFLLL